MLIFKWNETQVKLSEVLALTPHQPLFGQVSGRSGMTHWLVFMKPAGGQIATVDTVQIPAIEETKESPATSQRQFDPGHVVTREHYERLAREAAAQK